MDSGKPAGTSDNARRLYMGSGEEKDLGPLKHLPGLWKSKGMGWNMIALPFADAVPPINYRLLLNQYDEELGFTTVDDKVPNRGIERNGGVVQTDQRLATIDYQQVIRQVAVTDLPESEERGGENLPIHHEPGLWLYIKDQRTKDLDIARLATIPHGDSVLALGKSDCSEDDPAIPSVDGLPIGGPDDLSSPYLLPYKHFHDNPFVGNVTEVDFPGFDPVHPSELLKLAVPPGSVKQSTVLEVDSMTETGGIKNIPFIVKQANAASMKSTFWIHEMKDGSLILQYLQIVMLDFFARTDGLPGLIGWPHVSINTLTKESDSCTEMNLIDKGRGY